AHVLVTVIDVAASRICPEGQQRPKPMSGVSVKVECPMIRPWPKSAYPSRLGASSAERGRPVRVPLQKLRGAGCQTYQNTRKLPTCQNTGGSAICPPFLQQAVNQLCLRAFHRNVHHCRCDRGDRAGCACRPTSCASGAGNGPSR